jgi:hypothetical protein
MFNQVIKCEWGNKKLQVQGINQYSKFCNKSDIVFVEVWDVEEIYLTMKLDRIDKI